ncbi:MAG: TraR/DksA C4-type zinc finger protein [Chloroflexi bacterium]|nr:TraR/DksA C4-type zinc finger protein [Chloroflexota bacterium]
MRKWSEAKMPERQALDLDRYRRQLLDIKSQLEADLANCLEREQLIEGGPEEPGPGQHWEHSGYGDHLADEATEMFEKEKSVGLEMTLRQHLRQVDHALARIEHGTYGTCESCGRPIAKERLDALPEATLCIDCKAQDEREAPMSRRYWPGVSS